MVDISGPLRLTSEHIESTAPGAVMGMGSLGSVVDVDPPEMWFVDVWLVRKLERPSLYEDTAQSAPIDWNPRSGANKTLFKQCRVFATRPDGRATMGRRAITYMSDL